MKPLIILILLFAAFNIFSQEDTVKFSEPMESFIGGVSQECDVYLSNSLMKDVSIFGVSDSSLIIYKEGYDPRRFKLNSIKKISFKNHPFWTAAGYGFAGTVALLGVLGLATYSKGGHPDFGPFAGFFIGFVFGLPVGAIAGFVSEFAAVDDSYTFPGNNLEAKKKRLQYILNKHKK